jgi:glycosyltransferase involved in cell wall biosynthesis
LRNSINVKNFSNLKRLKRTFRSNKKTIIYVGRLIYAKGVQDLLDAVKDLNVNVWLIGEGEYKKRLMQLCSESRSKIKFLGQKNPEEIAKLLSQADIFVNPSYAEGLPTSVLEAGASGLPIIATDVGGTKEIIEDGNNGFLIKPHDTALLKDKINLLLDDSRLCERFSKNIQLKVKKEFDWKNTRISFLDMVNSKSKSKPIKTR